MSTDYGYGCADCGKVVEVENARSFQIPILRAGLLHLDAIKALMDADFDVRIGEHYYGFINAVEFALEHRALGHRVGVFDEYGREYDQCHEYIQCPCCKSTNGKCALKHGHDGPHLPATS